MDEGRKRVIGIIAGIIMARNLDRADDLFGGPQGSPRTDKMIAAAVQWAEGIMRKVDSVYNDEQTKECRSESLENQVVMAGISGRFQLIDPL